MSDFMDSQFWQKMFMYELTIRSLIQKFNATQSAVPAIILASSVTFDLRKTEEQDGVSISRFHTGLIKHISAAWELCGEAAVCR